MKAWHIHSYGGLNNLEFSHIRSPFLNNPDEILVEVHASSVNPIDIAIIGRHLKLFIYHYYEIIII